MNPSISVASVASKDAAASNATPPMIHNVRLLPLSEPWPPTRADRDCNRRKCHAHQPRRKIAAASANSTTIRRLSTVVASITSAADRGLYQPDPSNTTASQTRHFPPLQE